MEFDQTKTALAFLGLVAVATLALVVAPMMTTSTVLRMVTPSMLLFGLVCLLIGVKHGEFRATH